MSVLERIAKLEAIGSSWKPAVGEAKAGGATAARKGIMWVLVTKS